METEREKKREERLKEMREGKNTKRERETVPKGERRKKRAVERKRWLYNRMSEGEKGKNHGVGYGRCYRMEGSLGGKGGRERASERHCKRRTRESRGDGGENRYFNWTK